ncbi:hypothetical protein DFQ27_005668 [Actinomortierella ambigua]|uniref:Uncharacterized protein n=1 Tax=Actinomortierella ambigua TaxID=1343610 RepID=A0A9P6Q1H6_9FUNG|nr:hypothetical protein DFQ27_005668 [Actinomortierella ambigua]
MRMHAEATYVMRRLAACYAAVRHYINGDLDDASDALRPLHRKLRIRIESLSRTKLTGPLQKELPTPNQNFKKAKGSKSTVPMSSSRSEENTKLSSVK